MRHLKEFEKLVILLRFQNNFLMLKVTGTLTGVNTMTIFCWDYSVHNLYSKLLFCFPLLFWLLLIFVFLFVYWLGLVLVCFPFLAIILFHFCLQLPVYNYSNSYSGMCLLRVNITTAQQ